MSQTRQLLFVDYRENELGDYNEGAIILPVLSPGESRPFYLGISEMVGTAKAKEQRAASLAIRDGKAWKTYGTNTGAAQMGN